MKLNVFQRFEVIARSDVFLLLRAAVIPVLSSGDYFSNAEYGLRIYINNLGEFNSLLPIQVWPRGFSSST